MGAMELFDRVRLVTPRDDLDAGAIGTIVEVFERPERAYEVEFSDPEGVTLALLTLKPDEVRAVED
jgi:hypothetical protein